MIKFFRRGMIKTSPMVPILKQFGIRIEKRLRKSADYLGNKSEQVSIRTKSLMLLMFCLFFGGICFFMIYSAIRNKSNTILIGKVTIPNHKLHEDPRSLFNQVPALSERVVQNIQWFKHYMDSLRQSESGKRKYDSIIRARPGLMDSLLLTEYLYKQKIKTK